MATLNLGRIKPVFRGAYAGGTAYVVDDIVTSGDETFICIQASTGNATSNASYWTKLAAKGTDGTDVGTTLTTQGDILYRDGSGLQRLAKGTASQVLKMNSSANAPEWGNLSSDYVKLGSNYSTGINNSNDISIDGYFTSDYKIYKLFVTSKAQNNWIKFRLNQSNAAQSNSWYRYSGAYNRVQSGGTQGNGWISGWNNNYFVSHSYWTASSDVGACGEYTIFDPLSTTTRCKLQWKGAEQDATWWYNTLHTGYLNDAGAVTGLSFFPNGGNFVDFGWSLYGLKA